MFLNIDLNIGTTHSFHFHRAFSYLKGLLYLQVTLFIQFISVFNSNILFTSQTRFSTKKLGSYVSGKKGIIQCKVILFSNRLKTLDFKILGDFLETSLIHATMAYFPVCPHEKDRDLIRISFS